MKKLFFLLFITILFSCENKVNNEEKITYEVLSMLYDKLAKPIEPIFPPPPPGSPNYVFSSKDSARINSMIKIIKAERIESLLLLFILI